MSAHTPGPWAVSDRRTMKGNMIPVGGDDASAPVFANALYDEADANARLIAAAPDLLEALQFIVNDTPEPGEDAELTVVGYNRACAAIAKAVGKP